MTIFIIEGAAFFVLLGLILYFKVLSRPKLSEGEIGPFKVVYTHNAGSTWTTQKKIKQVQAYMRDKGIHSDTYICVYMSDPTRTKPEQLKSIVGCVIEGEFPRVEEPYAVTELARRYVAKAANENQITGMNKTALYPRLLAYMDVMGYAKASDQFIEIFHLGEGQYGFGKGFYSEICCRIREMSDEEIEAAEDKRINYNEMIFGKKGRFGN